MAATNLRLEGEDKWGNRISMPLFAGMGSFSVGVRKRGSLRRTFVPYREFASSHMRYSYIIER